MLILPKFIRTGLSPFMLACLFIVSGWVGFVRPQAPDCYTSCDPNISCQVIMANKDKKWFQQYQDKKGNAANCVRIYYTLLSSSKIPDKKTKKLQLVRCLDGYERCPPYYQDPSGSLKTQMFGQADYCAMPDTKIETKTCFCDCVDPKP